MERKHQHFTKPQLEALNKLSMLRDRPMAEIVRLAVDEYLARTDVKMELAQSPD